MLGWIPPPEDHALIGCWPPGRDEPLLPTSSTLVVTLTLVGSQLPHLSGFIRGTLPSGRILFQRRSSALYPFLLNDYSRFVRLLGPVSGDVRFVTGSPARLLVSPFFVRDIQVSMDSPFVPCAGL